MFPNRNVRPSSAYCSQDYDELNVWQEKGNIFLYLRSSSEGAFCAVQLLSIFRTDLSVTWESSTGLAVLWLDGRHSKTTRSSLVFLSFWSFTTSKMRWMLFLLCVLLALTCSDQSGLTDKGLFFPKPSANSFVKLTALKPLNLEAFTLCMRLFVNPAVVNKGNRDTILFAYCTTEGDELNVWQEKGKISLYLRSSSDGVFYAVQPLSIFGTDLCITWESRTGLTAFWVDGRRSTLQVYRKKHKVQSGGAVILGQDPDSFVGSFDINQSFVGEISDVNMWDYLLTDDQIKNFNEKVWVGPAPNVLNWNTVQYEVNGNVREVPEKYK
ncbi:hypothetical protein SRHO_G00049160 [Serrasalmus rhombeus]